MAELAPRIVDKGLASDRVVIETVVFEILRSCSTVPAGSNATEREAGVGAFARDIRWRWVMRVGELLEPVVAAMRADVLRASYIQADETIVPVQMHDGQVVLGSSGVFMAIGTLFNGSGGETVFDFQLSRWPGWSREIPEKIGDADFANRWLSGI